MMRARRDPDADGMRVPVVAKSEKEPNVRDMPDGVSAYRKARTLYTYDCQAFPSRDKAPAPTCAGHHTLQSGGSVHGDTPEIVERLLPLLQRRRAGPNALGFGGRFGTKRPRQTTAQRSVEIQSQAQPIGSILAWDDR